MIKDLGTDPSEFLEYNPFEASYELTLHADYANKDSIARVVKELKAMPKVVDMVYQSEQVETINDIISKVSLVLLVLAGLLTFVSFALINNTLRLSAYSRRFLIHTMKLVGATKGFIRKPFLWRAVLQGLVSAAVAIAALCGVLFALKKSFAGLFEIFSARLVALSMAAVIAGGVLICLVSTYFVVGKLISSSKDSLYY